MAKDGSVAGSYGEAAGVDPRRDNRGDQAADTGHDDRQSGGRELGAPMARRAFGKAQGLIRQNLRRAPGRPQSRQG